MKNQISIVRFVIKSFLLLSITLLLNQNVFSQDPKERDWQIRVPSQDFSTPVIPGNMNYMLWNLTENASVKYGQRKYGINLVWASSGYKRNIRFEPTSNEPIKYGDRIAIWVAGGGYLRYSERKYGINLIWSKKPVYEWEIRGGENGKPVQTRVKVAIYNSVEKDYVLYCERPYGINLKWSKTCENNGQSGKESKIHVNLNRQDIIKGYIPYLGSFSGQKGYVKSIYLPGNNVSTYGLSFVKKGSTTANCNSSDDVVRLLEQQTSTPDQMKLIFGTTEPRFSPAGPIYFIACRISPQNAPIENWVQIEITVVYD